MVVLGAGPGDVVLSLGAGSLVMLPYVDGDRTPDRPDATGSLHGLTRGVMTAENLAQAAGSSVGEGVGRRGRCAA
jgi:hypothetical protein